MQRTKRTRLILFGLAAAFLVFAAANAQSIQEQTSTARSHEPVPNPLLIVRERLETIGSFNCRVGLVVYGLSYSELTVFSNGQVQKVNWSVPPCSDPALASEWKVPALASEWKAPVGSKIRRFMLSQSSIKQLQSFLDRPEVRDMSDFFNAGPGVGDYDIEIHRASGVQRVPVLSLMPSNISLKQDPTLLCVICRAKEIGGDERPPWCADLTPTQPVPAR
jgi:hypothetical protein